MQFEPSPFDPSLIVVMGMAALGIALGLFWLWMLIDCATREPSEGNDKIVWILIIVFTTWIGALIYYAFRRPARIRQYGR